MPLIFQTRPGQVVKLDDPALSCNTNFLTVDPDISFDAQRSIITRLTISQQVNVQFLHTLGSLIYVYVFGDRMGSVSLSGLSFLCACDDGESSGGAEIGAEKMMLWYKQNRASKKAVVKFKNHFGKRHQVNNLHGGGVKIVHRHILTALVGQELQNCSHVF
jgi:hypothetical protein